jgi:hypothetical protein
MRPHAPDRLDLIGAQRDLTELRARRIERHRGREQRTGAFEPTASGEPRR